MAALRILSRVLVVGLWCSVGYASNVDVTTQYGDVQGFNFPSQIDAWYGVRFAAPAIGDLRWRPPQAPDNSYMYANTHLSCFEILNGVTSGSEADCLTMDIWAPANRDPDVKLPVMVYIHGGGFTSASPNFYAYNGTKFVLQSITENKPVIIVAITYRLGGLGFMAYNKLAAEAGSMSSSGNYGILDQIFALKYIQNNIDNFGGDKSKVTIWGESAGAYSVCTLLASPLATGLFKGAIMESSYCALIWQTNNVSSLAGDDCVQSNGCAEAADTVACLRQLNVSTAFGCNMETTSQKLPAFGNGGTGEVGPNIDGYVLKEPPLNAIRSDPSVPQVPVMLGSNLNEYNIFALSGYLKGTNTIPFSFTDTYFQYFLAGSYKNIPYRTSSNPSFAVTDSQANEFVTTMAPLYYGPEFEQIKTEFNVLIQYLCTRPGFENRECNATAAATAGYAFLTDFFFTFTALAIDNAVTANGRSSFRYLLKQNASNMFNTTYGEGSSVSHIGSYHNIDIPFIFNNWEPYMQGYLSGLSGNPGNPGIADPGSKTGNETQLTLAMQEYWLSFAYTSDPNAIGTNLPAWTKTPLPSTENATVNRYLELVQPGIAMGSGFHNAQVERLMQVQTNPDLNPARIETATTTVATTVVATNTTSPTVSPTTGNPTTPSSAVNIVANVFIAVIASIFVALF